MKYLNPQLKYVVCLFILLNGILALEEAKPRIGRKHNAHKNKQNKMESFEQMEKEQNSLNTQSNNNDDDKKVFLEKRTKSLNKQEKPLQSQDRFLEKNSNDSVVAVKAEVKAEVVAVKAEAKPVVLVQKTEVNAAPAATAIPATPAVKPPTGPVKPWPIGWRLLRNEFIKPEDAPGLSKAVKCDKRTGMLYTLKEDNYRDPTNPMKMVNGWSLTPDYIMLSVKSFNLQSRITADGSIRAIMLPKIEKIKQSHKNTACFDIIEEGRLDKPMSLCADSKKEMDDWIVAILEFKECILKENAEVIDGNTNAFKKVNFSLLNKLPHTVGPLAGAQPNDGLQTKPAPAKDVPGQVKAKDPYYYNNTFNKPGNTVEIKETDEKLTQILNDKKRLEIAQRQVKRQVEDKIRQVKEAHLRIVKENKALSARNSANKAKQLQTETKKIEDTATKQQNKILDAAVKKMADMDVSYNFLLLEKTIDDL